MRLRLAIASLVAMALAGCSFLLSEDFAAEDSPPPGEAGAADTTPSADVGASLPDAVTADAAVDADADAGLDPSLLAYWTFDHGATTLQRDETNRFDLNTTGGTVETTGGVRGGAIVFAGGTTPQVTPLSGLSFPKKGTLSIWFKHSFPDNDTTARGLFDDWDDQRSHLFIRRIGSDAPGRIQVALQAKLTSYAWAYGFDAQKNVWTHAIFMWDSVAKTAALYVDGVAMKIEGFNSGQTFDPSEQRFRLSDGWIGAIDEVRLYDRVLSEPEALLVP